MTTIRELAAYVAWGIALLFLAIVVGIATGVTKAIVAEALRPKTEVIVVPTCAELDSYGYDGLADCIGPDGNLTGPGR